MQNLITLGVDMPRKDKDGINYISYSQYSSYKSESGFNTGFPGNIEYIMSYFMGQTWPDSGFAQFGKDVEDYICEKAASETFTAKEREVMNGIVPLGRFQQEVKLWLGADLYLLGYIDDATQDLMHIRDYKTASENSSKRYYEDDYAQLDLYAMWVKQETGKLPDKMEVCIIERKGNCFGMVNRRDLLSLGSRVWYHERKTTEERLDKIKAGLMKVVFEISDRYKVYKQLKNF